eukprot:255555_1
MPNYQWICFVENTINGVVFGLGSILVIILSYQYIKHAYDSSLACFHSMILILFLLILMTFVTFSISAFFACVDEDIFWSLMLSGRITYVLQCSVLIWLLFYRLCLVFASSEFAVSVCTKRAFYCVYSIFHCLGGLTLYSLSSSKLWAPIMSTIGFTTLILVILSLVLIFVRKLMMVARIFAHHGDDQEDSKELIAVATKTFILTLWCIVSLLLVAIWMGIQELTGDTIHYQFVLGLATAFDLGTNFIAIWLGFKTFEIWYMKMCGFCQRKCITWQCFETRPHVQELKLAEIQSSSITHQPNAVSA